MSPPLKILMLGHCHSVFIHPLAVHLKRERNYDVSVFEYIDPGSEVRGVAQPVYSKIHSMPKVHTKSRLLASASELAVIPEVWRETLSSQRLKKLVLWMADAKTQRLRLDYNRVTRAKALEGYDIYNFQTLVPTHRSYMQALPPEARVVLSIWGTDLMGMAGVDVYADDLAICERANIITLRSLAMREIFLSKFGRKFLPKIRLAKFGIGHCAAIDKLSKGPARAAFCARYQIPPEKPIVCIGHSGCPRDRHVEIIRSLAPNAEKINRMATLVMPVTYRLTPEYRAQIEKAIEETGVKVRLLTDYMSSEEVAMLRLASNVMVMLPEQDALSGAMCETIYAGNMVITGAWLPYMEFWDNDIKLRRIQELNDIGQALFEVLDSLDSIKADLEGNKMKIKPLIDYEYSIGGWLAAYQAAMESRS